ncbi:hypothetical protein ABZZ79_27825 [Streptomyces sp. NPDC006458]|uniref:hypothetical protein n=1 Tax=Streptomyces sp. NPDC006458 TaxID=3154302 RepID=UPI0033A14371
MTDHVPGQNAPASSAPRRLVAAGFARRLAGRTLTARVTEAGVTGRLGKSERLAELHRACREDYTSSAGRRAQNHRDDVFLIAVASEAVAAR